VLYVFAALFIIFWGGPLAVTVCGLATPFSVQSTVVIWRLPALWEVSLELEHRGA